MMTVILCIVGLVWNRFIWPFAVLTFGLALVGQVGMVGQALQTGKTTPPSIFQRITVYVKMFLAVGFFLLPGLWLTWIPIILMVDGIQILTSYLGAKRGMPAFGWIYTFGRRNNQGNGFGGFGNRNNGMYGNNGYGQTGMCGNQTGYNQNGMYGNQSGFGRGGLFGNRNQQGMYGNQMYGNQMYGNQRYGNQMMGNQMMNNRMMNGQMMQTGFDTINPIKQIKMPEFKKKEAAGTIEGDDVFLIKDSKKVYITAEGTITWMDGGQQKKTRGEEVTLFPEYKTYAIKASGKLAPDIEVLVGRLCSQPVFLGSVQNLIGVYFIIGEDGQTYDEIHYGADVIKELAGGKVELLRSGNIGDTTDYVHSITKFENREINSYLTFNQQLSDEGELMRLVATTLSTYPIALTATKVSDDGSKFFYIFKPDSLDLLPPERDLAKKTTVREQETEVLGQVDGVNARAVEGMADTLICENGVLVFQRKSGEAIKLECDEQKVHAGYDVFYFDFQPDDSMNDVYKEIRKRLPSNISLAYSGQLSFEIFVTMMGRLLHPKAEAPKSSITAKLGEESEQEKSTIAGMKEAMFNLCAVGRGAFNTAKNGSEALRQKLKDSSNKELVADGVFNDGSVDLACQYGEFRCLIYEKDLPILQCLYVGKLIADYANNIMLDVIDDNWQEDVLASEIPKRVSDDMLSCVADRDNVSINVWIVGKVAYYVSLVLDLSNKEEAMLYTNDVQRKLLSLFTEALGVDPNEKVCYFETVTSASKEKFIEAGNTDEKASYYTLSLFDAIPEVFEKRLKPMPDEDYKVSKKFFAEQLDVLFRISDPLLYKGVGSDSGISLFKHEASGDMLHTARNKGECIEVDLSELSNRNATTVTKLITGINSQLYGKKNEVNETIKNLRKNVFIIVTGVGDKFEYSFVTVNEELLKKNNPLLIHKSDAILSKAFWGSDGKCSIDRDNSAVKVYFFKKG